MVMAILSVAMSQENICFASPSGNNTAYCVGTDYGDGVNTMSDAITAASLYQSMGLTAYVDVTPTVNSMNSAHANGTKYLESGIVFLSGHGTPSGMRFDYMGNGGDYAVGVTKGNTNYNNGNCYYYGLGGFALSDVALYVFAGCNTATGTNNLAKWAVDNGARISIGWSAEVGDYSHTLWLERFNDAIASGNTVMQACNVADSYTYNDSAVKNHVMYGYYYTNPYDLINPYSVSAVSEFSRPEMVVFNNVTEENAE